MFKQKHELVRYHADIYLPEAYVPMMQSFVQTFDEVDLTAHAGEQMFEDRRGKIPLPTYNQLLHNDNKLIELYQRKNEPSMIQKVVIRVTILSEKYDYCYVVATGGTIVTAWANLKSDTHRITETFDTYHCPENLRESIKEKLSNRADKFVPNYDL